MAKSKEEQIFIGIGDEVIELIGAEKDAFIAQREADTEAQRLLEAEYKAKQEARKSAYKKLGLTDEEIGAIL